MLNKCDRLSGDMGMRNSLCSAIVVLNVAQSHFCSVIVVLLFLKCNVQCTVYCIVCLIVAVIFGSQPLSLSNLQGTIDPL